MPGDQVAGQQPTQATGAAGDQHRAVGVEAGRQGEHQLAGVPCLGQEAQRLGCPADVPGGDRQGPQHSLLEQVEQLGEQLADPLGAGVEQLEGLVGHARVLCGDLLGVADVGLAHLDEPAAVGQQPQRGVHELAGQAVEHDVNAAPTRAGPKRRLEVEVAGGRQVLLVQPGRRPLVRAGRAEHLGTPVLGQLHRGHADPAGGGVHQHRLPRPQPRQLAQRVVRGQEDHRHRGGLREGPAVRDAGQHAVVGHGQGRERAGQDAEHPRARRQVGHVGTDLGDHPGALDTHDGLARVDAQRDQRVAEVQAGRPDRDPDLSGGQRGGGLRCGHERQVVHAARAGHVQPAARPRGGQSLSLILGVVQVDQHEPAGVLGLRGAHQPPDRCRGQVGHVLTGQHRDGAAGQHRQPGVGEARVGQPGPQQVEDSRGHRPPGLARP